MIYRVTLSAVGNPDFGQFGDIGVPKRKVRAASFEEASEICQRYIAKYDLGGGNWTGGKVVDAAGKIVARISYNGRIWPVQS